MKKHADKLVVGDVIANGDVVICVEITGNMVELDILVTGYGGYDDSVSIVVPCFEEFEVQA